MKAAIYSRFRETPTIREVPDPVSFPGGVVLKVGACGICRSDWHGWMGHDADVKPPHVPGHELSGTVVDVGSNVTRWKEGDRVTLPFVCGCGNCVQCASGNQQICDFQFQPGFTHWGAFAEYVAIDYADTNLVRLPDEIDFVTASSLGCRFITSYRAIVVQGKVSAGHWVAVHGCGGVGLSAIMISNALGASVVAIDIQDEKLEFAKSIGAVETINAATCDVAEAVREITNGGAHVSIDALGHHTLVFNSISCLRKRGKHIQVGLIGGDDPFPQIPMNKIVANELEILGSHGMQAYKYTEMLEMINKKKLQPERLIGKTIALEDSPNELINMDSFTGAGVTVINKF